jgi:hypothetical protein
LSANHHKLAAQPPLAVAKIDYKLPFYFPFLIIIYFYLYLVSLVIIIILFYFILFYFIFVVMLIFVVFGICLFDFAVKPATTTISTYIAVAASFSLFPAANHQNSNPPCRHLGSPTPPLPCFPCLFYLRTALTFGSNSPVHNPSYHSSKSPPPSSPCQSQSLLQFCILQTAAQLPANSQSIFTVSPITKAIHHLQPIHPCHSQTTTTHFVTHGNNTSSTITTTATIYPKSLCTISQHTASSAPQTIITLHQQTQFNHNLHHQFIKIKPAATSITKPAKQTHKTPPLHHIKATVPNPWSPCSLYSSQITVKHLSATLPSINFKLLNHFTSISKPAHTVAPPLPSIPITTITAVDCFSPHRPHS